MHMWELKEEQWERLGLNQSPPLSSRQQVHLEIGVQSPAWCQLQRFLEESVVQNIASHVEEYTARIHFETLFDNVSTVKYTDLVHRTGQ